MGMVSSVHYMYVNCVVVHTFVHGIVYCTHTVYIPIARAHCE